MDIRHFRLQKLGKVVFALLLLNLRYVTNREDGGRGPSRTRLPIPPPFRKTDPRNYILVR